MAMVMVLLFTSLGYFQCDLAKTAATIAGISLVATAVESLSINQILDDNLTVPAVAALLSHFLLRVTVLV